jgi:hydrogenase large subunit
MTRKILGPFNRVEGDLEVEVEGTEGGVTKAWVNSPL